jgi:hypothetical protein
MVDLPLPVLQPAVPQIPANQIAFKLATCAALLERKMVVFKPMVIATPVAPFPVIHAQQEERVRRRTTQTLVLSGVTASNLD